MRLPMGSVRFARAALLLTVALVAVPGLAFGFQEPSTMFGTGQGCSYCHPGGGYWNESVTGDCYDCHADVSTNGLPGYEEQNFYGPHGGYITTTRKCRTCHDVHQSWDTGVLLLRDETVHDNCLCCHDGTGGYGVYGAVLARTTQLPGGGHGYDETAEVPGGNPATGGASTRDFNGTGNTLTCTDCHAVHGSDTVVAFRGDRRRVRNAHPIITSDRLLKRLPTGASTPVDDYGSDWCLACHGGRAAISPLHNHPVDSAESSSSPTWVPYNYSWVPVLASDDPTAVTVRAPMGGITSAFNIHGWPLASTGAGNRAFLMPYPRTAEQQGHAPICQQCHEDTRSVGTLVGDGSTADAAPAAITQADGIYWDGLAWQTDPNDNPLFQNFPHETQNQYMLVEANDDLCLNCHPMGD